MDGLYNGRRKGGEEGADCIYPKAGSQALERGLFFGHLGETRRDFESFAFIYSSTMDETLIELQPKKSIRDLHICTPKEQ